MFEAAESGSGAATTSLTPMVTRSGNWKLSTSTRARTSQLGTVKVGLPTRHRLAFVPLAGAIVGPGYIQVARDRKQVKDSPSITTDGELPAADEEAIFKHYGLPYQAGTSGERQLARR